MAAHTFSSLVIDSTARLSGVVTLNGKSFRAAALEFIPRDVGLSVAQGSTDSLGHYAVDVMSPGAYWVKLKTEGIQIPGERKLIQVVSGDNTFDLALTGGSLSVKFANLDLAGGNLRVVIAQTQPRVVNGAPGTVHNLSSDDPRLSDAKLTIHALGFAEYTIRASQAPRHRGDRTKSAFASVALTEARPAATVTLTLEENTGALVLIDPTGAPITGAKVYGNGVSAREIEPGTFSLDRIPPNLPLHVRANGFTPICRVAGNAQTTVVLDRGRPLEMRFPTSGMSAPWGEVSWRGSDCPIALDAFPFIALPASGDGTQRFRISHFPHVDDLTYIFSGEQPHAVRVTGDLLVIPYDPRFDKR